MKKILILLLIIFFAINAFGGKGGNPLVGQWVSSDGKDYLVIVMDDENQRLVIVKDGFKHSLTKENEIYTFKNKTEYVQVDLNPSNGNLELISNNKKIIYKKIIQFIELNLLNIFFLLILGFIGGLVSGFIGSGGAFVLTPGIMSLGVDGLVAIASNMCHKFPKALVGAFKRYKYGQVDLKLGLIMASCAVLGVLVGIEFQQKINNTYGNLGSDLYVSLAYVIVLTTIGSYVFYDAFRTKNSDGIEKNQNFHWF